ncbi:hypothetical protein N431DRAFT_347600 [Stipitochalara longipes BDJ]|nr:hypothetical protein N431DRAFT_347600 [Stipitochalara longipes BDJ]
MASYTGAAPTKSRTKVKPILRKLTQSEKNSLDLDRPAAEQDGLGIYDYGTGSRSSHDVNVNFTTSMGMGRRGYHNRSTSGTSQFSIATTGSGQRTGSFVHPFQQTPRPYTPPLAVSSYQNSLRESDSPSNSPTEEDDPTNSNNNTLQNYRSASNLSNHRNPSLTAATSSPPTSQLAPQPLLRIQTKQSSSSRLALATSHTSLHNDLTSPTDTPTMSPSSAMRTSMDKGFRIRSRSELDSRGRTETIQEARRKFQEKELAKEEKAAREEIRALEKRNQKEARQIERGHRRSSASDATRSKRSKSDLTMTEKGESLVGREYDSVAHQNPPVFTDAGLGGEGVQRREGGLKGTKKKTHSAWTKLMMWLRTRFIRMGGKRDRS